MASVPEECKCQYTYLGRSGLRVSNICLGAGTFGEWDLVSKLEDYPAELNDKLPSTVDEATSHKLLNRFVEWGGNFIDTANVYGNGNSEKIVGSWLAGQDRDRYVIATKVRLPTDPSNPNAAGLGRRHITESVDRSLERLQTDHIDLLQSHLWDDGAPIEETLMTFNDLVRCGKVRYLGASNVTGWQLQKIVDFNKHMGFSPFISLQQHYSLLGRNSELEPFQVCKLNGLGVLPWSPLRGGFLTGKIRRDKPPEEGRLAWAANKEEFNSPFAPTWKAINTEKNWTILDTVEKIAIARGKSIAQVSLRWLLQKPIVSSVIIGATKMHQMEDNLGAANGWQLTEQEMKELDEASQPDIPYPYEMIWRMNATRNNPWNPSGNV